MAREYLQLLPEVIKYDEMRLGRHVEFWKEAQDYAIEVEHSIVDWVEEHLLHRSATTGVKSVVWQRRAPIFNQGNLGSCTGNAAAGARGSDSPGRTGDATMTEQVAVQLYSEATRLDPFPGEYLPTDTGSSGTGVCKAMQNRGWVSAYRWAFSVSGALTALKRGPILLGVAWVSGMDSPDANAMVRYEGMVRGGHEFLCRGFDATEKLFVFDNSWGEGFGDGGSFYMTVPEFTKMIANNGDIKQPVWV